ncbi:MAG: ParB/RepB/Spo0J family partition protein [Bacteroidia bacterium]
MSKITRKSGLGRGLNSILPTDVSTEVQTAEIPLHQIEPNPYQPREHFDEEALEELAASIRQHGIIQPLTVRKLEDRKYQLISGERRLRAARMANLKEVPAYVREADDEQMLEMGLIENIQREDLNPIEIAISYHRMIEELKLTHDEIGEKVGKKRVTITNFLGLLKLPEKVQLALRSRQISTGHAKAIHSVKDPVLQLRMLADILERDLSVRQTEEIARKYQEPVKKPEKTTPERPNTFQIHLNKVQDQLTDRFGNKVRINRKSSGKGEIAIPFNSDQDLNRILEMFDL